MAIQNTLLQSENEGLLDALTVKKRREIKGKPLDLLQHYEYWGPSMMWTPRSFREAKTRLAISQVTQFELTELTAKTQFSQSVLEAAGRQFSQFRGH
jgi:hypothetical protein